MLNKVIEELVYYAKTHLELDDFDAIYIRNKLLAKFNQIEPYEGKIEKQGIKKLDVPDILIQALLSEYGKELDAHEEDSLVSEVMSLLSPMPSKVRERFNEKYNSSPEKATEYLYEISKNNYYVQKTKVLKNKVFTSRDGLEISINLSKPEKNNKDIAKLVGAVSTSYPKCVLCLENLGFEGNAKKAARQNIRFVPLNLGGETWYLQYSPYGYFNRHCIVFSEKHTPMIINRSNLSKLFDFVDMFPHFIIGSNSDLPITGGSILDHEHFQGGDHIFPMMKREVKETFESKKYPEVKIGLLDWYNSTIVLRSKNREDIINLTMNIIDKWYKYDNPDLDIISYEGEVRHNSITPILRKIGKEYIFYVMLRNNRQNDEYPDGIFHAHPEYHHIKKEGIGLIEAMGLFILPARLERQLPLVEGILENHIEAGSYLMTNPDLEPFVPMIEKLRRLEGNPHDLVQKELEDTCRGILDNTAVFKNDERGRAAFIKFVEKAIK